jgi:hypothetical protein
MSVGARSRRSSDEHGQLQLSCTRRNRQVLEVIVDHQTGRWPRPGITKGDDLTAAKDRRGDGQGQRTQAASTKRQANAGFRAVSVFRR